MTPIIFNLIGLGVSLFSVSGYLMKIFGMFHPAEILFAVLNVARSLRGAAFVLAQ